MRLVLLSVLLIACGNMPLPVETVDGSVDSTNAQPDLVWDHMGCFQSTTCGHPCWACPRFDTPPLAERCPVAVDGGCNNVD